MSSGGGAVRSTAARARLAARLLAVLGCVLTAEAQVGASGGWNDAAAGSPHGGGGGRRGEGRGWPGRDAPAASGRAADPRLRGRRAEDLPVAGWRRRGGRFGGSWGRARAASGRVLCSLPAGRSGDPSLKSVARVLPVRNPAGAACRDRARARVPPVCEGRSCLTREPPVGPLYNGPAPQSSCLIQVTLLAVCRVLR